jgi:hypothetical protein
MTRIYDMTNIGIAALRRRLQKLEGSRCQGTEARIAELQSICSGAAARITSEITPNDALAIYDEFHSAVVELSALDPPKPGPEILMTLDEARSAYDQLMSEIAEKRQGARP